LHIYMKSMYLLINVLFIALFVFNHN
jgi:hypothetical protein